MQNLSFYCTFSALFYFSSQVSWSPSQKKLPIVFEANYAPCPEFRHHWENFCKPKATFVVKHVVIRWVRSWIYIYIYIYRVCGKICKFKLPDCVTVTAANCRRAFSWTKEPRWTVNLRARSAIEFRRINAFWTKKIDHSPLF